MDFLSFFVVCLFIVFMPEFVVFTGLTVDVVVVVGASPSPRYWCVGKSSNTSRVSIAVLTASQSY